MPCKVTLFYNQAAKGWTETYYAQGDDPYAVVSAMSNKKFLNNCVSWRSYPTYLYAIKASLVSHYHNSYTAVLNDPSLVVYGDFVAGTEPDVTTTCAIVRMWDSNNKSKRNYLRGLRDKDVMRTTEGRDKPSADLLSGLQKYVAVLADAGLCTRTQVRPPDGGITWRNVGSVSVGSTAGSTAFLDTGSNPNLNITSNPWIVFQGIPKNDLPGFPNPVQVLSVSTVGPFGITIPYRVRASNVPYYPQRMKFTVLQYTYSPLVKNINFERFAEHKTGRPFGQSRGRRQVLVKRS